MPVYCKLTYNRDRDRGGRGRQGGRQVGGREREREEVVNTSGESVMVRVV
jgi:hypothetical protein